MPAEELGPKYFTRERIRNRMLKKAAEVWGYSESELDEFDPLVTLLIEANAVELERVAGEIAKMQKRMLERLAQLLYPEITMVRPAYSVMQASSSEPFSTLTTDAQFIIKAAASDRRKTNNTTAANLYFSPARDIKLVNGRIAAMASCREIFTIEEGVQKISLCNAIKKSASHTHSLWLGLQLDPLLESLEKVSFFFNWLNDPDAGMWYQQLPYCQWSIKGYPIKFQTGLISEKTIEEPSDLLEQEFDSMKRIEEDIFGIFSREFITIISSPELDKPQLNPEIYPQPFELWFEKKDLQQLKEALLWVEIKFPTTVTPEAIDDVLCSINCFPVINRKLNKLTYKLQPNLNIVPLESEGSFLSVKEISNTNAESVKLIPFGNPYDLQQETYTLRYGVNRFNERNAYETLVNLLDLVREESAFFSSLGQDFLTEHVREMNQIIARMDSKIKGLNVHEAPFPFLAIRKGDQGGLITVEFWSCMGEAANKIPMGAHLSPYQVSGIKNEGLYMMTTSTGGRDNMSDAEKLVHYKKALFTRNRVVTIEDIKTVAMAELGKSIETIDIRKTFMKSSMQGEGFIRCIHIVITAIADDETNVMEWEQKLLRLKMILEKQSSGSIPFHLSLQSNTE